MRYDQAASFLLLDDSLSLSTASYQQYRAPQAEGQTLIDPPPAAIPELLEKNRQQIAHYDLRWGETTLVDLAKRCRKRLLTLASTYISEYAEQNGELDSVAQHRGPVIVSGHQPELFHPGVWFKNFALDQLAKRHGGLGIHLLIDSDECRIPSVRVPNGTVENPRSEAVPLDLAADPMPYEVREVRSIETLSKFATGVQAKLASLGIESLASKLMPKAVEAAKRGVSLGRAVSSARHRLERRWGSQTLELPLGMLEESPEFAEFAKELLSQASEARETYNAALNDYRVAHRLRSNAQPLPDLSQQDGWCETPFWIWSKDSPVRRGLFVKVAGDALLLGHLDEERIEDFGWQLSIASTNAFLADWQQLHASGVKIRTRALATTLFARLLLGDLFLHGIGGAKYDQVTDRWAEGWLGLKLPGHVTLSGTWRLPIEHPPAGEDRLRAIHQELRGLVFHPEVELAQTGIVPDDAAAWVAQKRQAIALEKTPDNAAERHGLIVAANKRLQPFVESKRQALLVERDELRQRRQAAALLDSREYSLALYPEQWLRERMTEERFAEN